MVRKCELKLGGFVFVIYPFKQVLKHSDNVHF